MPVSVIVCGRFRLTFTLCALAVGVPAATVMLTVAGPLVFWPLLTVKVKLSAPW